MQKIIYIMNPDAPEFPDETDEIIDRFCPSPLSDSEKEKQEDDTDDSHYKPNAEESLKATKYKYEQALEKWENEMPLTSEERAHLRHRKKLLSKREISEAEQKQLAEIQKALAFVPEQVELSPQIQNIIDEIYKGKTITPDQQKMLRDKRSSCKRKGDLKIADILSKAIAQGYENANQTVRTSYQDKIKFIKQGGILTDYQRQNLFERRRNARQNGDNKTVLIIEEALKIEKENIEKLKQDNYSGRGEGGIPQNEDSGENNDDSSEDENSGEDQNIHAAGDTPQNYNTNTEPFVTKKQKTTNFSDLTEDDLKFFETDESIDIIHNSLAALHLRTQALEKTFY